MDAFIGEIRLFAGNYPPYGWKFCNGDVLPVNQFPALYSILGNTYGGSGGTTFQLPDLRGRVPMGAGIGNGLTPRSIGNTAGSAAVTLSAAQIPAHTHTVNAKSGAALSGGDTAPTGHLWRDSSSAMKSYAPASAAPDPVTMAPEAVSTFGTSNVYTPYSNVQPCVGINYIICWDGNYPTFD